MTETAIDQNAELFIRHAKAEDRPSLVAFMGELQAHEAAIETNRANPTEMAEPHVAALEEWAARAEGGFLVAEMGGAIVGFVIYGIEEEFGYFVQPQYQRRGRISDLYVEASWRERGVGAMLMRAAEDALRAAGAKRAEITTLFENIEARGFYETGGYRPYQVQYAKEL